MYRRMSTVCVILVLVVVLSVFMVDPYLRFLPITKWLHSGSSPAKCLPIFLMAYFDSPNILYKTAKLFFTAHNKTFDYEWQEDLLIRLIFQHAQGLVPGGFMTPRAFCLTIEPEDVSGDFKCPIWNLTFEQVKFFLAGNGKYASSADAIHVLLGKVYSQSHKAQAGEWPTTVSGEVPTLFTGPLTTYSCWILILAFYGSLQLSKDSGGTPCPGTKKPNVTYFCNDPDKWKEKSNFLTHQYGLIGDSSAVISFLSNTASSYWRIPWSPLAFQSLVNAFIGGSATTGYGGGWYGMVRNCGNGKGWGAAWVWRDLFAEVQRATQYPVVYPPCNGVAVGMSAVQGGLIGLFALTFAGPFAIVGLCVIGAVAGGFASSFNQKCWPGQRNEMQYPDDVPDPG
jgi:hypothetical protein